MSALRQSLGGRRQVGVLLHVTALPSGGFGAGAQRWLQLLSRHRVGVWQVLPLNPVGFGYSPYQSPSAFAINPMLISPEALVKEGWLGAEVLEAEVV
ncbi:MAG: 4-alpha-glucanotransferase, partial [Synechococcus sp.]|nr:4-alpha-glucanotransferase [Synechococcus sp.]